MNDHLCECGCGQQTGIADRSDLRRGVKRGDARRYIYGHQRRGFVSHPMVRGRAYQSWTQMRLRCENPNSDGWKYYGARGITVCDRWRSFANFFADMGDRPSGTSLDRINNDGHYEPGNCRWATPKEQASNRRNNRLLTIGGETKTQSEWCRQFSIDWCTVRDRLSRGWSAEDALQRPIDIRRRRKSLR